jgi:hypothetical protein
MSLSQASWLQHPHVKRTGFVLLFYLFGPMIVHARHIWRQAAGPKWRAKNRWKHIFGSALLSLLWYVPVVVLHAPLFSFWASIFEITARFLHVPIIAWFGGTAFFLPFPNSLLLRWLLASPLAGLAACGLETFWPRTTWESKRVLSPDEQLFLAQQMTEEQQKIAALPSSRSVATKRTPITKKRKPHTQTGRTPAVPPANSLWGRIDWNTVSDTHPLQREALAAKRETQEHAQSQTQPDKNRGTVKIKKPASPPEYNWDEGEGSIPE